MNRGLKGASSVEIDVNGSTWTIVVRDENGTVAGFTTPCEPTVKVEGKRVPNKEVEV